MKTTNKHIMKNFSLYLTHPLVGDELNLKDKNVIVIDVLRATTTIPIALLNGAKEVIPTDTTATAVRVAKGSGNSLLCGERNGKIIEGFDFGNSPLEYNTDQIKDKTLIFSTTNGTLTIVKSKHAKQCILCSFINLSTVVDYINSLNEEFIIICAGKNNNICLEDSVCAGLLIGKLTSMQKDKRINELNDSEIVAANLCIDFIMDKSGPSEKKILEMLNVSEHGRYLVSLGFEKDLEFCSKLDSYPVIPLFKNGIIKLKEKMDGENTQKLRMKKVNLTTESDEKIKQVETPKTK
jgi:2-phosphosulfolactate phosphatase